MLVEKDFCFVSLLVDCFVGSCGLEVGVLGLEVVFLDVLGVDLIFFILEICDLMVFFGFFLWLVLLMVLVFFIWMGVLLVVDGEVVLGCEIGLERMLEKDMIFVV